MLLLCRGLCPRVTKACNSILRKQTTQSKCKNWNEFKIYHTRCILVVSVTCRPPLVHVEKSSFIAPLSSFQPRKVVSVPWAIDLELGRTIRSYTILYAPSIYLKHIPYMTWILGMCLYELEQLACSDNKESGSKLYEFVQHTYMFASIY